MSLGQVMLIAAASSRYPNGYAGLLPIMYRDPCTQSSRMLPSMPRRLQSRYILDFNNAEDNSIADVAHQVRSAYMSECY